MNCPPKASEQISPSSIITSFCVTLSGFLDSQVASRAKKWSQNLFEKQVKTKFTQKQEIGRPSISNKFPTMPTTSFNPRNLSSTCQSQKMHNTKSPPKSDDIPQSLWCACYKYACIYQYQPRNGTFRHHWALQSSSPFYYQGYQLQNHRSQQHGLTTKQPYR